MKLWGGRFTKQTDSFTDHFHSLMRFLTGVESPYSLYNENIASFTTGELYNHFDAEGFINLFGLPLKVRALMRENLKK